MSVKNIVNFIIVNLAFLSMTLMIFYWSMVDGIKKDWPNNRCNPIFMGFADNVQENFQYCVMQSQSGFMGYLLEPLYNVTGSLADVGGSLAGSVAGTSDMIDYLRTSITSVVGNIFTVFLNIIIEFQRITISMKDLMQKMMGVMAVMMYILSGSVLTMQSLWAGPVGQTVKALGSVCFHESTKLRLKSGKLVCIKDLQINDILQDETVIYCVMKIKNNRNEHLYVFKGKGEDGEDIIVSESHYVNYNDNWIQAKYHPKAKRYKETAIILYNLMTSTNKIPIGEMLFSDYNDDLIHYSIS